MPDRYISSIRVLPSALISIFGFLFTVEANSEGQPTRITVVSGALNCEQHDSESIPLASAETG
jgi:hypothetical protein